MVANGSAKRCIEGVRRAVKGKLLICLKSKYATQSHPPPYPIFAQNIKANISWIFNISFIQKLFYELLEAVAREPST